MRSRLLVSAAILAAGLLVAGLAAASAQNAPGGVDKEHHNGLANGRHDGHDQLRNQNRRATGAAARKAEPLLRTRATGFGFEDSNAGTGTENPRRNPRAMAKRHGNTSPGQMSQQPPARGDLLPPAKPSDASVLPPRGQWGRGDRDGMASDRSIWDRARAQGRLRSDRIGQGDREGRNRGLTRSQRREPASALLKERGQQDLARNKAPHRRPDQGMGRADERAPGDARNQVSSGAALDPAKHRGGTPNARQDEIREVQAALNQQGFNVGGPDGRLGRRTKEALIAFQKQRGFQTTGKVDPATRHALLANAAAPAQDKPGSGQPSPAQPAPHGAGAETTGQSSAAPRPAPASPQPIEGETSPPTEGLQMPDSGASGRVPAGSPQEDYKDDTPAGDQR